MNREQIIQWAREAGFEIDCCSLEWHDRIERFAALVAAAKEAELMDGMTIAYMDGYENGKDAGAAAERLRFADECIDLVAIYGGPVDLEAAIRARSCNQ